MKFELGIPIECYACPVCDKPHSRLIDVFNHLCWIVDNNHKVWLERNNFDPLDKISRKKLYRALTELDLKKQV